MHCPNCGLISPDSALWCDCGFDFSKLSKTDKTNSEKIFKTNKHKYLLHSSYTAFFIGILLVIIYSFFAYIKIDNITDLTLLDHLKIIFNPNGLRIHVLWPAGLIGIVGHSIMLKIYNNKKR